MESFRWIVLGSLIAAVLSAGMAVAHADHACEGIDSHCWAECQDDGTCSGRCEFYVEQTCWPIDPLDPFCQLCRVRVLP